MMLTFRAGKVAALAAFLFLATACSREQQDWRSAEAADTVESYGQFLERHPESELVTQARTRLAQLTEDREWQHASSTDTADAYRQFLAQHPNGKWAQEARIRIQNFALNGLPPAGPPMGTSPEAAAAGGSAVPAGAPTASGATSTSAASGATAIAAPNELAHAAPGELAQTAGSAANAAPRASQPAQASPGELAHAAGTQVAAAAPAPTTAAAAPVSPAPPKYSTPYVSTPTNNTSFASGSSANASSGYGVQLGAFGSASAAKSEWQQLTARFGAQLSGLTPRVVTTNTATGTLFRLQAQVPDEAHARSLCDMLKKQSQPCVPVLPH